MCVCGASCTPARRLSGQMDPGLRPDGSWSSLRPSMCLCCGVFAPSVLRELGEIPRAQQDIWHLSQEDTDPCRDGRKRAALGGGGGCLSTRQVPSVRRMGPDGAGRWQAGRMGREASAVVFGPDQLPSLPDGRLRWPPTDLPGESYLSPPPSWKVGASVSC